MASTGDKSDIGAKKAAKPVSKNPVLAEAQRKAEAMASNRSKPVSFVTFLQEAKVELQKTSWPSREVLTKSTTVVLAFVLAVAVWVGVLDAVFTYVMRFITGR